MRRQEQWLLLADRLKLGRAPVIAVCVFLNMRWKPERIARELGIERPFVEAVADAAKPLLRQSRRAARPVRECAYCGSDADITTDHVMPRSRGGSDAPDNIVWACRSCNSAKGNRTPEEWLGGK